MDILVSTEKAISLQEFFILCLSNFALYFYIALFLSLLKNLLLSIFCFLLFWHFGYMLIKWNFLIDMLAGQPIQRRKSTQMFYTNPSFLVLFVFFLFIWEYTILKKEKNHKTLIRKMALQGNYRQKYRHYGEHFISPSVIGLPCFFGFLTSTTFARKKRTNFHHFIGFIGCFT